MDDVAVVVVADMDGRCEERSVATNTTRTMMMRTRTRKREA